MGPGLTADFFFFWSCTRRRLRLWNYSSIFVFNADPPSPQRVPIKPDWAGYLLKYFNFWRIKMLGPSGNSSVWRTWWWPFSFRSWCAFSMTSAWMLRYIFLRPGNRAVILENIMLIDMARFDFFHILNPFKRYSLSSLSFYTSEISVGSLGIYNGWHDRGDVGKSGERKVDGKWSGLFGSSVRNSCNTCRRNKFSDQESFHRLHVTSSSVYAKRKSKSFNKFPGKCK